MDFVEKENTRRNDKPKKGKVLARLKYYCYECHGMCVFSREFFEKHSKSNFITENIDEKFYEQDFDTLRRYFEQESHCEDKMRTGPKCTNEDEDESEEESPYNTFDTLKKYHSLGRRGVYKIGCIHGGGGERRINKLDRYDLWRTCRCCLRNSIRKRESRQKRQTKLVFISVGDIKIQC